MWRKSVQLQLILPLNEMIASRYINGCVYKKNSNKEGKLFETNQKMSISVLMSSINSGVNECRSFGMIGKASH